MKIIWKGFVGVLLVVMLTLESCSREPVSWDVENAFPLFHSSFSLGDIDNKYLRYGASDTGYRLEYENNVYTYRIADLQASDTGINESFNLRKLRLNDQIIENKVTLGQINPLFNALNGQTLVIPAQDQSDLEPTDVDASAFFETATLDTGYLDISISNELPVNISLIIFELRNAEDNSLVALDSFTNIAADGGKSSRTIDLAGKTVTKSLKGVIKRMITEASSGPVLIDASKGITLTLGVRNLRPNYAVAAFPTQDVIDQDEGLTLDMNGAEIKYFKVRSGRLKIKVISTIQEDMSMVLALPGASKGGSSFYQELSLPGPAGKGVAEKTQIYDLSGYLLDFRGKDPELTDTVNTFHQILRVTLDSSGRKLAVGLQDSIVLEYRLEGLKPEYAIGYLGNTLERTGVDTTSFELFKGVNGDLQFKDLKVDFVVRNSIGTDGRFKLFQLDGYNEFDGKQVALDADPLKNEIFVTKPDFVRDAFTDTRLSLDVNNSNIKSFFEALPQRLIYDLETEVSPNGNVNNYTDFVFDNSKMEVFMKMEMPISFAFGGLVFRDTQAVDFSKVGNVDRIKSATLMLDLANYFPLDLDLEFQMFDAGFNSLGYLDTKPTDGVKSAITDDKGYTIKPTKTNLSITLPREKVGALVKTKYLGINLKAKGSGSMQKVYSNTKLNMRSKIRFEYEVRNN